MISLGLLALTLTASTVFLSLSILVLVMVRMSLISWLPKGDYGYMADAMMVSIGLGALAILTGIISMASVSGALPVISFVLFILQMLALLLALVKVLWTPKST
jgi:hypothetical protein